VKPSRDKSRRPSKTSSKTRPPGPAARPARAPFDLRLGTFFVWLLVLVPPLLLAPTAKESFRQPKLLASGWLALASLAALAWGLRRVGEVRWADVWRRPAVRAVLPALVVATAGLAATRHPLQVREGLADLWIGAACLVGWSLALPAERLERLLRGLLGPAALLGLLAALQFHGLWQPLRLLGLGGDDRLAVTSTAGNPGDLGGYLVLPCLIGQWALARRLRAGRAGEAPGRSAVWGTAAALAVCLYALVLTQTLAALAALLAGTLLLWGAMLPRRRMATALGGLALAAAVLVLAVAPLRERVAAKGRQALQGDWNEVLTGRLDGWYAAGWMLSEHPWTGVGHGAYRPEFVPAKLALLDRGVDFYSAPFQTVFANAHNEYLEVAAEWGIPGILVLAWGLWVLGGALRRARQPLAWAGAAALAVLSLAHFPFRIAIVAFPALLFLAWIFRQGGAETVEEAT
jgi:O-antigen ligase